MGLIVAYRSVTTLPYLVVQFQWWSFPHTANSFVGISRQEKLFHSLQTQFLWCVTSFETLCEDRYYWVHTTPLFILGVNVAVCFLLGER